MADTVPKPVELLITPSHYKYTLYLASIYALTELISAPLFVNFHTFDIAQGYLVRAGAGIIILIGIFLYSNFVRYAGAAWFVLIAGSTIWPMLTSTPIWNVGVGWVFVTGALTLPLIWFLLISKKFSNELSVLRNTEPKYKKTLRKTMLIFLAVAAAIATLFDIIHLVTV